MLAVAKTGLAQTGEPNRHALHDVGLAMGALTVQAAELGLTVHQMGGFDVAKTRAVFRLPADCDPVTISAIGFTSAGDVHDDAERERRRARRLPLDRIVSWGDAAHWSIDGA
jgi:nitroreductase